MIDPHENDVLTGRGKGVTNHPGNIYMKELVEENKAKYVSGSDKEKKTIISQTVETIKNRIPPGRFLTKEENSNCWSIMESKMINRKIGAAMRDASRNKEKKTIISQTVETIQNRSPPGRFLPKEENSSCWSIMESKIINRKIGVAMRDASRKSTADWHPDMNDSFDLNIDLPDENEAVFDESTVDRLMNSSDLNVLRNTGISTGNPMDICENSLTSSIHSTPDPYFQSHQPSLDEQKSSNDATLFSSMPASYHYTHSLSSSEDQYNCSRQKENTIDLNHSDEQKISNNAIIPHSDFQVSNNTHTLGPNEDNGGIYFIQSETIASNHVNELHIDESAPSQRGGFSRTGLLQKFKSFSKKSISLSFRDFSWTSEEELDDDSYHV